MFFNAFVLKDDNGTPIRPAAMHEAWQGLLSNLPRLVIWAHAQSGKTLQMTIGRTLWELGREPATRILILSTQHAKIAKTLASYIEESKELHAVFPKLHPSPRPYDSWKPLSGILTVERPAKAAEPSVTILGPRAAVTGAYDLIIVDDIIDAESTKTSQLRQATIEWLGAALRRRVTAQGKILFIGQSYAPDDAMQHYAALYARETGTECLYKYAALDDQGAPRWPEAWSKDRLEKFALEHPETYKREMLCDISDGQGPAIKAARESLAEFVRQAWELVDPDPLVWNWHLDAICSHLEAVTRGEITKLLINVPPGHAKSLIVAVFWPAWIWIHRPEWRSLFASYSSELSVRDSVRCRTVIESEWYQTNFAQPSNWRLRGDQNAKHNFINTKAGHRFSTSVGGAGAGFRGDLVAIDDPLNSTDAFSKAARIEAIRWLGQTMSNRLNDMATGRMVMIMQRLHEEDPAGFVLSGGGWEHLNLPSEFEEDRRCVTHRFVRRLKQPEEGLSGEALKAAEALGETELVREVFWTDPRTTEGELLFPQKFSREVLEAAKEPNSLGADGYAGQHQQRPTPAAGGMFKREAWRFHKPDGAAPDQLFSRPKYSYQGPARPVPKMDRVIMSVDSSFKETASGSFNAIHIWGRCGADRFLLDRFHARCDFEAVCKAIVSLATKWPSARTKIIEEKANGAAIISQLQKKVYGLVPVNPEGGKESRAQAVQPYQAAGNCYLPDGAPWLDEFISEFAAFPLGKHDDDVDAMSQALMVLEDPDTTAAMWARARVD